MDTYEQAIAFLESKLGSFKCWETPAGYSPQKRFIRAAATHTTRLFRCGNRNGKTTGGAVDVALHLLGWHPCSKFEGPVHWWASGLYWEFGVGQILWPAIREFLPEEMISDIAWYRKGAPSIPKSIVFANGSQLDFKSADSGWEKYQGAELNGVWADEEHPWEIIEECRTRLLKTNGYLNLTLTPVQRLSWINDVEKEEETTVIRSSMIQAAMGGILDLKGVLKFARALPVRQRRVRVFGDMIALEGRVYPNISKENHGAKPRKDGLYVRGKRICPWPIPPAWRRLSAMDFGVSNPSAVPVVAVCPSTGRLIVEKLYYSSGIRYSVWAKLLKPRLPDLWVSLICDHDANGRLELESEGINTVAAKKDIEQGIEAVERFLDGKIEGVPKLVFVINEEDNDPELGRCDAEKAIWEGERYHFPKRKDGKKDPDEKPVKKDDHALDAIRYLVLEYESMSGGPPAQPPAIRNNQRDRSNLDGFELKSSERRESWSSRLSGWER